MAFFDIFRKMLLENGFQNNSNPFYVGYVSAEFNLRNQLNSHNMYQVFKAAVESC